MREAVLILRDNDKGGVEMAGLTRPPEFDPTSPSHLLLQWIHGNMEEIIRRTTEEKVS